MIDMDGARKKKYSGRQKSELATLVYCKGLSYLMTHLIDP